jgi:hypothetical protein
MTDPLMQFFSYEHLRPELREVSAPFAANTGRSQDRLLMPPRDGEACQRLSARCWRSSPLSVLATRPVRRNAGVRAARRGSVPNSRKRQ